MRCASLSPDIIFTRCLDGERTLGRTILRETKKIGSKRITGRGLIVNMYIAAVSDTHGVHGMLDSVPYADVFVHSGDFTGGFVNRVNRTNISYSHKESFLAFLSKVERLPHRHKIIVPGNHDQIVEVEPKWAKYEARRRNIFLLVEESVVIDGVKFYGYPWTKEFYSWFFNRRDIFLQEGVDQIPNDTDILISHGPPWGILDVNGEDENCGCPYLRERLDIRTPELLKYVIFGHIHESGGKAERLHGMTMVNAALHGMLLHVETESNMKTINGEKRLQD